jgi:hypothetical protein
MEVIGILLLFGIAGMAFWVLIFLVTILPGWIAMGARDIFRELTGKTGAGEAHSK